MDDYIQPPDDLVLIEQERAESLKDYTAVIRDNRKPAPIQYVKVKATCEKDAALEVKKIVPENVTILKIYPA